MNVYLLDPFECLLTSSEPILQPDRMGRSRLKERTYFANLQRQVPAHRCRSKPTRRIAVPAHTALFPCSFRRSFDRLDQFWPLVAHSAYGARHRVPRQASHRQAGHGPYLAAVQLGPRAVGIDDDRHAVMDGVQSGTRRFGQDGAGQPLIVRQRDRRPQPRKQQRWRVARGVNVVRLLRAVRGLPFEISAGRHHAARALVGVTVADEPDEVLLSWGVPEDWLDVVRDATDDTVLDIASHLPAEAGAALVQAATGNRPHPLRPRRPIVVHHRKGQGTSHRGSRIYRPRFHP